jgi:hypothetical protein
MNRYHQLEAATSEKCQERPYWRKAAVRCRSAEVSVARKLPSIGPRRNMAVDAMRDGGHEQLTAYYEAPLAEACPHFDRLSRRCRPERPAGQKEGGAHPVELQAERNGKPQSLSERSGFPCNWIYDTDSWLRSSVWICDFSSAHGTTACASGDIEANDVAYLGQGVGIGRELDQLRPSNSPLASFRSSVSKPSVNQP